MSVSTSITSNVNYAQRASLLPLWVVVCLLPIAAMAQEQPLQPGPDMDYARMPIYVIPGQSELSTLYFDGSQIEVQTEQRWRFMDGYDPAELSLDDLIRFATNHASEMDQGPAIIVDRGLRGDGFNIVYNLGASVPTEAVNSFALAEAYLEDLFGDNMTVTISCTFDDLGSSVLGSTSSTYISNVSYTNSRNGLQSGMDGDDVLQAYFPDGTTIPVRYNGSSATVTNENRIDWTKANYKATIGMVTQTDASMVYNNTFNWDYNPANGVGYNTTSMVDVICHETGHALGFVSAVDNDNGTMQAMDLYRFCRQDGDFDYNPDTFVEFGTTPRIVDFNNPNDQQNTDLINYSYRMEDGNPWQASHFRQDNAYGCMCPAISSGFTRYPNYYTAADINVFDALGYDYPPCDTPVFTIQPEPVQTACLDGSVSLTVAVDVSVTYQWRKGTTNLVDDGAHIWGATTDTLTIVGLTEDDANTGYNCHAVNNADGCPGFSDYAEIIVDTEVAVITTQPQDQTVDVGDLNAFYILLENSTGMLYQWRKDGNPLTDDDRIAGATSNVLIIDPTQSSDAGEYDCVVTYEFGSQCSVTSDTATLTVEGGQGCPNPGTSGNYCTADIDGSGDCAVNLSDLAQLLSYYGTTAGATPEQGDIEPGGGDGDVDLGDLAALLSQYGDDCN